MSERYEVEPWEMGNGAFVYDGEEVAAIAECDDIGNARMIAAALNASAQRDAERKLLERAEGLLRSAKHIASLVGADIVHSNATQWLAEYAALQAEVSDG